MIKFFYSLALALALISPANASPIVADLSNYTISMDAGFNGTRLFVFGARGDSGDVVVVIRGENKNYIVRKKEEFAGMWINKDRMKFLDMPNFYAIASSKPLSEMEEEALFTQLGIGENSLSIAPTDLSKIARFNDFEAAFLDYQHEKKLYSEKPEPINFIEETLFKTTIDFSDNIPAGNYTAEIYLLSDGEVVGMQSTPITVVKSGIDAFIYNFAHNSPALYGIVAILLALSAGWGAGRLFENRN
jgi:uncharacterized protein (TIGR02186 family)